MPDYGFNGLMRYGLTRDDELRPLEEPINCVVEVFGYAFKITENTPYEDGPVAIQVVQNGIRYDLQPDSDGVLVWKKAGE